MAGKAAGRFFHPEYSGVADGYYTSCGRGWRPYGNCFSCISRAHPYATTGDGDVDMGMPVETKAISINGAENADFQHQFAGGIQQVIHCKAAEVAKQPAVNLKQGLQRVG